MNRVVTSLSQALWKRNARPLVAKAGLVELSITGMLKPLSFVITLGLIPAIALGATEPDSEKTIPLREISPIGETVEKQLPLGVPSKLWGQDESVYPASKGDRIETQTVLENAVKTIKLHNVVPPIRYGSGDSEIPESYIGMLRDILDKMKDRKNVRLHFVGHSDNVQLRGAVKEKYGDNTGLSRERAGTAAEFFQRALDLPRSRARSAT